MNVVFQNITYSNIMSVGAKPISIQMDQAKKTLITGHNGAGKSTMLEALCFMLYGRPFRNIKKAQLVNSTNKKGLLVEGNFTVGPNAFYVKRGIKPNILEIHKNGEKLPELASVTAFQEYFETELLGISFESFKQVIVLGTAGYTPFMELSAGERRSLVEDLLDLTVLGEMEKNNKGLVKVARQNYDMIGVQIEANRNEQASAGDVIHTKRLSFSNQRDQLLVDVKSMITQINEKKVKSVELVGELESIVEPSEIELSGIIEKIFEIDTTQIDSNITQLISTIRSDDDIDRLVATESESINKKILECQQKLDDNPDLDFEEIRKKLTGDIPVPVVPDIDKPADVVYPEHPCKDGVRLSELRSQIAATQTEINDLQVDYSLVKKQLDFVVSGGECPTCGSSHEAGSGHVGELESKVSAAKSTFDGKNEELNALVAEQNQLLADIESHKNECAKLDQVYRADLDMYEKACADYAWAMREYGDKIRVIEESVSSRQRIHVELKENTTAHIRYLTEELGKVDIAVREKCRLENENIMGRVSSLRQEISALKAKADSDAEAARVKWKNSVDACVEKRKYIQSTIDMLNDQIKSDTVAVKSKKAKADELNLQVEQVDTTELDRLLVVADELMGSRTAIYEELAARDVISNMLKDSGIKAQVVRQYIPVFNKRINGYLQMLGADYVFTLDETFNESIKSRGREEFSYTSFSQGERARINLSLLFTWRDIASIVSGVNINLLVLDELFDSATDAEGVKAINTLLDGAGGNVFVISHRAENMNDSFDRHLKMMKKGRFTVQQ